MVLDTPISVFRNARSTDPSTVALRVFLESKKYGDQVAQIRAAADKATRDQLKKELPAATISGTFRTRNIQGIDQYNGLLCMDFDAKENPEQSPWEMKNVLSTIDEVVYAGLSVSGTGVFCIIATDNDDPTAHSELVNYVGGLIQRAGLNYDKSCKDVCRLRFVSADPAAYIATTHAVLPAKDILQRLAEQRAAQKPRAIQVRRAKEPSATEASKVERLIERIEAQAADITGNYEDWLYLAFALANEFGNQGEEYFQRISQYNPKYDPVETEKKYNNALRTGSGRVKIGTLFAIATKHGIRLK